MKSFGSEKIRRWQFRNAALLTAFFAITFLITGKSQAETQKPTYALQRMDVESRHFQLGQTRATLQIVNRSHIEVWIRTPVWAAQNLAGMPYRRDFGHRVLSVPLKSHPALARFIVAPEGTLTTNSNDSIPAIYDGSELSINSALQRKGLLAIVIRPDNRPEQLIVVDLPRTVVSKKPVTYQIELPALRPGRDRFYALHSIFEFKDSPPLSDGGLLVSVADQDDLVHRNPAHQEYLDHTDKVEILGSGSYVVINGRIVKLRSTFRNFDALTGSAKFEMRNKTLSVLLPGSNQQFISEAEPRSGIDFSFTRQTIPRSEFYEYVDPRLIDAAAEALKEPKGTGLILRPPNTPRENTTRFSLLNGFEKDIESAIRASQLIALPGRQLLEIDNYERALIFLTSPPVQGSKDDKFEYQTVQLRLLKRVGDLAEQSPQAIQLLQQVAEYGTDSKIRIGAALLLRKSLTGEKKKITASLIRSAKSSVRCESAFEFALAE